MNIKNSFWVTDDTVLSKLVKDGFDVYINASKDDPTSITLNFLDLSKFEKSLNQDYYNFAAIYSYFCSDVIENFYPDIRIIFDKYQYDPNHEENRSRIQTDIKKLIKEYETENNINLLELFLQKYLRIN